MMVKFHSSSVTDPETAVVAYPVIGSRDQIIAGLLVKSRQHYKLRGKEWIVVITDHDNGTDYTLCVCDGRVI